MGLSIENECRKCHRSNRWSSDFEIEESVQVGCQYCQKPKYPQYTTEYNSGSNVWVIFKEYWKPIKSWFGLGPVKDYLVTEVLRVGYEYDFQPNSESTAPELEFYTLKEAKDYIEKIKNTNIKSVNIGIQTKSELDEYAKKNKMSDDEYFYYLRKLKL